MSASTSAAQWQFSRKIMLPVIVAVLVTIVTVGGFIAWSIGRTDSHAIDRQTTLLERALEDRLADVPVGQADLAVWDEALDAVDDRDTDWLHENIGLSGFEYYSHDRIYILDAAGRPVYAMRDGGQVNAKAYETERASLDTLVGQLDHIDNQAAIDAYNNGIGDVPPTAFDLMLIEGQPAIVSAMPLLSYSGDKVAPVGTEPVLVVATLLSDAVAAELTRQYLFENARFVAADQGKPGEGAFAVRNGAGETIAWFTWEPDRPGARILNDTLPALVAALAVAGGIIAILLRNLNRASAQLQAERAEAHHRALHDPLTGLGNRALFRDRLDQALRTMPRGEPRLALLALDLDRFKQVNDTLGHDGGDELLRQVSSRVTGLLRPEDTLVRLGGDEFAVVMPAISAPEEPTALAQRIVSSLAAPFHIAGQVAEIGVSVGIATAPDIAQTDAELVNRADNALYRAKSTGRNRYCVYGRDEGTPAELEQRLRDAFDQRGAA